MDFETFSELLDEIAPQITMQQVYAADRLLNAYEDLLRQIGSRVNENIRLRHALKIIAGIEQPIDNLMSNQEIAMSALRV